MIFRLTYLYIFPFIGLPALIVAISLSIRGPSFYGLSGHCWLSRSNGFIWAAMAPMIVVLLVDIKHFFKNYLACTALHNLL